MKIVTKSEGAPRFTCDWFLESADVQNYMSVESKIGISRDLKGKKKSKKRDEEYLSKMEWDMGKI